MKQLRLLSATVLAVLCAALLALSLATMVLASPDAPTAVYPTCGATLQVCINAASAGDIINIQAGTYTESITLNKAVSLIGADAPTTIFVAPPAQRVITVTGASITNSTLISGLTFARGVLTTTFCPAGCGGGMLLTAGAQPLLQNLIITNNVAYRGGGLYADTTDPLNLRNGRVLSNSATLGGGGIDAETGAALESGFFQDNMSLGSLGGGGLYVGGALAMTDTQFLSNTASGGSGGGANSTTSAKMKGGLFQNNKTTGGVGNVGGGLHAINLLVSGTQFISNTANGTGGGVSASGTATLNGAVFQRNNSGSGGGGMFVTLGLVLTDTSFVSNTASGSGGGVVANFGAAIEGGLFQENRAAAGTGGGLSTNTTLLVSGTQFISNTASGVGGGVYSSGSATFNGGLFAKNYSPSTGGGLQMLSSLVLSGTSFFSNTGTAGGGGVYAQGTTTVTGGTFENNQTPNAGGAFNGSNTLMLTGTRFVSNTGQFGGGVYLGSTGGGRLVNAWFSRNTGVFGDALSLYSINPTVILHVTVGQLSMANGTGIYIGSGQVGITNTIVASQTTGIANIGGTTYEDYNLLFADTNPTFITSGGTHDVANDPAFVDPAQDDLHLTVGSAAIDRGFNLGITTDADGDPRPIGPAPDIGADEFGTGVLRVFLPLIRR